LEKFLNGSNNKWLKKTFFEYVDNLGIDLYQLELLISEEEEYGCCFQGCCKRSDNSWIMFSCSEPNGIKVRKVCSEDECFEKMKESLPYFLSIQGIRGIYKNKYYELTREQIVDYIVKNYGLTQKQAKENFDKLKQSLKVLMEFKYYIVENHFINSDFACSFNEYTTEKFFNGTSLNALGAFNYMIYIKINYKEALEHLKNGLYKRRIIQNPEKIKVVDENKGVWLNET